MNPRVADPAHAGLSTVPAFARPVSGLAASIRRALESHPFAMSVLAAAVPGLAVAAPQGGQVVAGSASISNPDANTTLITQSTTRTAIDWQRFSIGSQEYVQFTQPDSASVALNRVIGGNPSEILGNLSANGQVFLVNPNGVYFGPHATVDVGGIVASVLDIRTNDFMKGRYAFVKGDDAPDGTGIVNDGLIRARDGGYAVLLGDYVHNNGVISAHMGTVALAAGNRITMDVKGDGLVSVAIDEETFSDVAGVRNAGEILAGGGRVAMTAKVANDLVDTAINNEGLVVANSIVERNGEIFLAGIGGDVVNSGTLDASAEEGSGADGGRVLVYADEDVTHADGASIRATGDGDGDGGVVRVIAEDVMDHQAGARIDVTSDNGEGGFVEVSGHGSLALRGDVDLGAGGELLIDPLQLTLVSGLSVPSVTSSFASVGTGFIANQLNSGVDVTLVASNSIGATTGSSPTISASNPSGNLSLKIGTLSVTGTGSLSGTPTAGTLGCVSAGFCVGGTNITFTPAASGSINLANVTFNLAGGLTVAGGTTSGNVSLNNVTVGGSLNVSAGGDITFGTTFSTTKGDIDAGGDVVIDAGGNVGLFGTVKNAGSGLQVNAGGDVRLGNTFFVDPAIGASAGAPLDAPVTITAGGDIDIQSDIYVGNHLLTLNADANGDNVGDVLINALGTFSFGTIDYASKGLSVKSAGSISITGQNVKMVGADGSSAGIKSAETSLHADNNITINVADSVQLLGGRPSFASPTNGFDASARMTAGGNIDITGSNLSVQAGTLYLGNIFGTSVARANAEISATNIDVNLSGNMGISGGTYQPTSAASGLAEMSALVSATNSITVNASMLTVSGGGINASSFDGISSVTARAELTATDGANNGDVNLNIGGNIIVMGGSAIAAPNSFGATSVNADASAVVHAGNVTTITTGNDLTVSGGSATASARGIANSFNQRNASASVKANADISANNQINITAVGGNLLVMGKNANANAFGSAFCATSCGGTFNQNANANALANGSITTPNGAITIGTVTGGLSVTGGNAIASATGASTSGATFGTGLAAVSADASADAGGLLNAGSITVSNVTGNLSIGTGSTMTATGGAPAVVSANATAVIDATTGDLAINTQGSMNATGARLRAAGSVALSFQGGFVDSATNRFAAGTSLSVAVGGNFAPLGGYSAGSVTFSAGGNLDINSALGSNASRLSSDFTLSAGNDVNVNADIYLGSNGLTINADSDASGVGDVNVSFATLSTLGAMSITGNNMTLNEAGLNANSLSAMMAGNIGGSISFIDAGGLYLAADGNLDLGNTGVTVGTGTAPGVSGDADALSFMALNGIPLPDSADPNAAFRSGGTLSLNSLTMQGGIPYLLLNADNINLASTVNLPSATDIVVQFLPYTQTGDIGVEAEPSNSLVANYNNLDHFSKFPATTLIIGGSQHQGNIIIGSSGEVNIGAKNMMVITSSTPANPTSIDSIDNVISTGIVAELIVGQTIIDEEFVTPVLQEFEAEIGSLEDPEEEREKKKKLVKDDEEETAEMCEV